MALPKTAGVRSNLHFKHFKTATFSCYPLFETPPLVAKEVERSLEFAVKFRKLDSYREPEREKKKNLIWR